MIQESLCAKRQPSSGSDEARCQWWPYQVLHGAGANRKIRLHCRVLRPGKHVCACLPVAQQAVIQTCRHFEHWHWHPSSLAFVAKYGAMQRMGIVSNRQSTPSPGSACKRTFVCSQSNLSLFPHGRCAAGDGLAAANFVSNSSSKTHTNITSSDDKNTNSGNDDSYK